MLLFVAGGLHILFFINTNIIATSLLWIGFIQIAIMLHFKFDFIKLDDWYEEHSVAIELSDYWLAAKMLGYGPWILFVAIISVAFLLRLS